MTEDGRCPDRIEPRELAPTLTHAVEEAASNEERQRICRAARRELDDIVSRVERGCNNAADCRVIEVFECGSPASQAIDADHLERRWAEVARACSARVFDCSSHRSSCEAGRCEWGRSVAR